MKKFNKEVGLIISSGLFDSEWYLRSYPDVAELRFDPVEHYLKYGAKMGRDPGLTFKTRWYLEQYHDVAASGVNPLLHYIMYGRGEGRTANSPVSETGKYGKLMLHLTQREYVAAKLLCDDLLIEYENDWGLLAARASLEIRTNNWESSLPYWSELWDKYHSDKLVRSFKLPPVSTAKPLNCVFKKLTLNDSAQIKITDKVVVYTSLFGGYDDLRPIDLISENIDFVCFTDRAIEVRGWKIIHVNSEYENYNLSAKRYKILPHEYFGEYEYSLFVDASTFFYGNVESFIARWLVNLDFVMFQHPDRNDAYHEAEAVLTSMRHEPAPIVNQISSYRQLGLPRGTGLAEASFIWRRHNSSSIRLLMDDWWSEINKYSRRDQISLCYLMWKSDIRPAFLPKEVGTSRINNLFCKLPHKVVGSKVGDERNNSDAINKRVVFNGRKPRVVFLHHDKHVNVASTLMRGQQLSLIVKNLSRKVGEVNYTSSLDIKQSIVVLTKGMLKEVSRRELEILKKNDCILISDYVDDKPRSDIIDLIDVYLASSIRGLYALAHENPGKLTHLITHHVDPRLPVHCMLPKDLAFGYFGELANAQYYDDLKGQVKFHRVNTKHSSDEWLSDIVNYNCHYAVRKNRIIDGYKPFLKGFTAAKCGANILVSVNDGDASLYLGEDYPYLISDDSFEAVSNGLAYVRDSYGGQDWRYALEIMNEVKARSSDAWIAREFDDLLDMISAM